MPVNKVIYGGVTLLDLTKDTVTAEKLLKGETAHGKDGSPIVGTLEVGGGADITHFGFTKAVFGTTTGSQSFMHNLDETPKCVIFWSDDVFDYAITDPPQYIVRAGIGLVLHAKDGTTEVVESYSNIYYSGGSYSFSLNSPKASQPRTGFDVVYNPSTSNSGAVMYSKDGTIYFRGEAGSGYSYILLPAATYHWGVFA